MSKAKRYHIDRRAPLLMATSEGGADDLLSTRQTADWLGVSTQWLEIGRSKGFGPSYVRVSPRRIRYRRDSVLRWLAEREYARTTDYAA
jgi:hypothetical protein